MSLFSRILRLALISSVVISGATFAQTKIMPFGNSVTAGNYGAGQYGIGGYRNHLYKLLKDTLGYSIDFVGTRTGPAAAGVDPDHEGIPGFEMGNMADTAGGCMRLMHPDYIFLEGGVNDLQLYTPLATSMANLNRLLDSVKLYRNSTTKIIVGSVHTVTPDFGPGIYALENFNAAVAAVVAARRAAGETWVAFLDLRYLTITFLGDISSDGTHYWDSGYEKLGAVWAQAFLNANLFLNSPAIITITAPTERVLINYPATSTVTITASVSDGDGQMTKMEFFNGYTKIGEDLNGSDGWSFTWTIPSTGTYYISARGTELNNGAYFTSNSAARTIIAITDPRNAENPAYTSSGLNYTYYEKDFGAKLPDFTKEIPVKGGNIANFDLSPKLIPDYFGFSFDGFINVPVAGVYTFYTRSDDNSSLYLGSTLVVDNDLYHAPAEREGTINLTAGKHAISVRYKDAAGGELLEVSWTGPGISKQLIPNANLFRVPNVAPVASLTAPLDGSAYSAGSNITLSADVTDGDGNNTINQVAFYQGTTFIGSDNSAPYSFVWNNAPAGTYSITARAIDNLGATGTSSTAVISVNSVIQDFDAFSQIEAEAYSSQFGISTETCSEGGLNIGWIDDGDYIVYTNVNFSTGAVSFNARVASANSGGSIELHLDNLSGPIIGTCGVPGTGGWQSWITQTCTVTGATGSHSLYLKFTGNGGGLFNVNWFSFTRSAPVNQAPTVATAVAANPGTVNGTTTVLSALGADDAGESALTYTWATTGTPPAAVTLSANGTNSSKSTTVTFTKAGSYSFQVTIKDAGNLTVTSSINVTVNQTLTTITVSPSTASVATSATQQFAAAGVDQFGTSMAASYSWSVSGGGSVDASGLFAAGTTAGGPFTVTATSGSKNGTAAVSVTGGSGLIKLTGTAFGTQQWNYCCGGTDTSAKAFDGNAATFFDGNDGNNGYAGIDLGTVQIISSIRYFPRAGFEGRSNGGKFQGSNTSSSTGFTDLYTIGTSVAGWSTYAITNGTAWRYVRFISPNANCNPAEIEFYISSGSTNTAPTVAAVAVASPKTVTATTSNLSVLGADNAGEAALIYTWAATTVPAGGTASFSINGTNASKNTVATFSKAGSYTLQATIKDAGNLTVISSVNVIVNQTLTTITVTPATASVPVSATQQFTASGVDQFGAAMAASCTWSVSGGGSINTAGLFTAGTTAGGPYVVTATSGTKSQTGSITITAGGLTAVYQINTGASAVSPYAADQYSSGGNTYSTATAVSTTGVTNAAPAAVYQSERYGNMTYTFGSLTANATHTVRLHFAEIYFTSAGSRTFNVSINGAQVLSTFDIYSAAGGANKAIVKEFTTTANASGQIIIQFTTIKDNAKISGIQILK